MGLNAELLNLILSFMRMGEDIGHRVERDDVERH